MKLILLESRNEYDQKVLHGVFSSREAAEQAIPSVQAAFNVQEEGYEEYKNRAASFFKVLKNRAKELNKELMNASDKSRAQMENLRATSRQINQHKVLSFDDWAWINYSRPPKDYFTFTEISLDEVVCT